MSDKATKALAVAGLCVVGYVAYQDHQAKPAVQKRKKRRKTPTNRRPTSSGGRNVNFVPLMQWGLELMNLGNSTNNSTGGGSGWSWPWSGGSAVEPKKTPAVVPSTGGSVGSSTGFRLLADLQRDFGLTRPQAAGIVGNCDHETGGFKFMQEIKPVVPGSRGGYGICQWTGPRRRAFEAWAAKMGLSLQSYAANYGFLKHELTSTSESRVIPKLKAVSTAEDAASVFSRTFLRPGIPHMASRIARAKKYDGGGWA